jgi:hypothetical protein
LNTSAVLLVLQQQRSPACRLSQHDVQITVLFGFESNDAARESEPFIFNPGAL